MLAATDSFSRSSGGIPWPSMVLVRMRSCPGSAARVANVAWQQSIAARKPATMLCRTMTVMLSDTAAGRKLGNSRDGAIWLRVCLGLRRGGQAGRNNVCCVSFWWSCLFLMRKTLCR